MFGKLTLIKCRHCSKEVSIESKLCVHCGCPEPDKEKFLTNQYNSHPSFKLYKFFDSHLTSGFVDFCGWVSLGCMIPLIYNLGRTESGLDSEKYLLLIGTICGSIYVTFYIYIKKYWWKKVKIEHKDWFDYLILGIIFLMFIFGLLFFFLIQFKKLF